MAVHMGIEYKMNKNTIIQVNYACIFIWYWIDIEMPKSVANWIYIESTYELNI